MALIEIRGLKKLYRMGDSIVQALAGVDLTIERGEFVAITGASGSGKSTMMHLIGCLDRPTAGTYRLNGADVSNMSDGELARVRNREIGFVFQTFNLINRTSAVENVTVPLFYARKYDSARAKEALSQVGLGHRLTHRPSEMSGGERQRTAIARAIVNDPVLLLADEPTGNLDSRTGDAIMQVFHDLNSRGVTIVLVTHEPDIARQARRIVSMKDGRIIADGTPDEVLGGDLHATVPADERMAGGAVVIQQSGRGSPGRATATLEPLSTAPSPKLNEPNAVTPAPDEPVDMSKMTARMAPGASWPLVLASIAWLLLIGVNLLPYVKPEVARQIDPELLQKGGKNLPPEVKQLLMWRSLMGLGAMLSLILGVVALFWGRAKLRFLREELGNWIGRGRIRLGTWLGAAVPLFMVGAFVLRMFIGKH